MRSNILQNYFLKLYPTHYSFKIRQPAFYVAEEKKKVAVFFLLYIFLYTLLRSWQVRKIPEICYCYNLPFFFL